jgi:predicted transcriptional regulator
VPASDGAAVTALITVLMTVSKAVEETVGCTVLCTAARCVGDAVELTAVADSVQSKCIVCMNKSVQVTVLRRHALYNIHCKLTAAACLLNTTLAVVMYLLKGQ